VGGEESYGSPFAELKRKVEMRQETDEALRIRAKELHEKDKQRKAQARANMRWLLGALIAVCTWLAPIFLGASGIVPCLMWALELSWMSNHALVGQLIYLLFYGPYTCFRIRSVLSRLRSVVAMPDDEIKIVGKRFDAGFGIIQVRHVWCLSRVMDMASDWSSLVSTSVPTMYFLSQFSRVFHSPRMTFRGPVLYLLTGEDIEQLMVVIGWQVFDPSVTPTMSVLFPELFSLLWIVESIVSIRHLLGGEAREADSNEFDYIMLA